MEDTLGLLDSLLVALALGARGIRERVEGSQALGIELVISELALPLARRRLRRIDHPSALRQLRRDGTRLRVIADQGLEVTVLPPLLTRRHCAARLAESGVELPPRLLEVAHQILDLSLRGVDSFLCADDGNVGLLRAQLAAVEPFTFLGTGSYACSGGVGALSLAAAPPRGCFAPGPSAGG